VKVDNLAIIGAGGWGTALGVLWANLAPKVILWGNNQVRIEQMRTTRENRPYLPGIRLPDSLHLTNRLEDCSEADLIVLVVPSTAMRTVAARLRDSLANERARFLSCTKGIEHGSGMRMSEILTEIFPKRRIGVLSGPNLAPEVSRGLPTATVLACSEPECATELQALLGSAYFRIYTADDVPGVELGGALKNVFALAAGASEGLGLGDNSKAALVTRALAELIRLGTAMGGWLSTFYGLSGAGDLVLTCYSKQSRNRRVGERLGRGESLQQITSTMQMIAEGVPTANSAYECARKLNIDTPIIDQVYALLYENKPAVQALTDLLGRAPKPERT
jgi:glycerol-3-phosphate dehydrogenase (NAD(P)+)